VKEDVREHLIISVVEQAADLFTVLRNSEVHSLSWPLELPDGTVIVAVYNEELAKEYTYVGIHLHKAVMVDLFRNHYPLEVPLIIVHGLKGWLKYFAEGQELAFDSPSLRCTRLLAYLYDPPEKSEEESEVDLTLAALVRKYCKIDYPLWGVWIRDYGYPEGLYRRLMEDAAFTYNLWHKLMGILDQDADADFLSLYHDIELPTVRILLRIELQGVRVDQTGAKGNYDKASDELLALRKEIESLIGSWVNPNSPKQVRPFMTWLLHEPFQGPINDETFETLIDRHPALPLMLQYRKTVRNQNFFGLIGKAPFGRVYPRYHQCRITTGRISVTDPALQNIPKKLREPYLLPEPGHHLVEADYKQAEARLLAYLSGDKRLIEILGDETKDLFEETANYFNEVDSEPKLNLTRAQAKTLFYAVTYGVSAVNLGGILGVDEGIARSMISEFKFSLFHEVGEYVHELRDYLVKMGKKGRRLNTPWGRTRMFDRRLISLHDFEIPLQKDPVRDPEVRRAFNFLLQGNVADLIKQVQIRIDRAFRERGMATRVILNLHDGLYLSVPPSEYPLTEKLVKEAMESPDFIARIKVATHEWVDVPLKAEMKILRYAE
jgi:DNA polymerase I-like protein with 3'-5' exonuclease and polymerase domains